MVEERVPVLVVGAGLAGLSTAMFLARRGVRSLVVEKHAGTSIHPRASGQSPRTMELLRFAGIHDEVLAASYGMAGGMRIIIAESMRGTVYQTILGNKEDWDASAFSPLPWGMATQDRVEPIMLERATELGARVSFSTELISVDQDDDGVTATLLDRTNGRLTHVRADYLVAADGGRSPIRERLGIACRGPGTLGHSLGVLFEADLSEIVEPGSASLYYLKNPAFTGVIVTMDNYGKHGFGVEYHPENGESAADFPPERITELLRIATDVPDLTPTILGVQAWEIGAKVAERFRDGRVFLAGDAAKVTPPTGGLGGNTAVQDGYDLAWKLAAVLRGEAGAGLLDSYEPERRPFAEMVVAHSMHNAADRMNVGASKNEGQIDAFELQFGYRCRSAAVLAEDDEAAPTENPREPSGRPGFRAPHVPLILDGTELSTVDLFGGDWVVFTGPEGGLWHEAARHAADRLGVPVRAYGVGPGLADPTGGLVDRYGLGAGGASLVRPDGVVAWRATREVDDPAATLHAALATVLSRQ
ncbi:FAD-dependent monooxygenase [Solihabitans fulvus]|uniref:FAD-dependent monooxygenase n=1 Tax=Solihabitans fulvus TaxID=1892852 RepID=A0A5B2WRK7_9PSEU|nr:FAD-dependent monooxygenase [Solihabitans fulvus]KAA2254311.1 FAD-dependent monooxygenase [Solihabitans fulvus]